MPNNYLVPQVKVQEDFASIPSAIVSTLTACIVGPHKKVYRYTDALEKAIVSYGAYDYLNGNTAEYAGLPDGAVIDQTSVGLVLEALWAKYATLTSGLTRGTISNQVVLASGSFVEYINSDTTTFTRNAIFNLRNVTVGDRVKVTTGLGTIESSVTGFVNNVIAPILTSISASTGNSFTADQSATTTIVSHSVSGRVLIQDVDSDFIGNLAAGYVQDTYTLTALDTTGNFQVTSLHGDNQASVQILKNNPTDVGTRGWKVEITDAVAYQTGETIVATVKAAAEVPEVVLGNSITNYVGEVNTTYLVKVVKGGTWSQHPQVVITTNNNVDASGGAITVTNAVAFALGTLGLTLDVTGKRLSNNTTSLSQGGLVLGDTYLVKVVAAKKGAIQTVILADPLDSIAAASASITSMKFYIYKASLSVPTRGYPTPGDVDVSTTATDFTVHGGIQITDSTWVDLDGVTLLPIPVEKGNLFIPYEALLTVDVNALSTVSDLSTVPGLLGEPIPQNPLAYGVNKALENSGGQVVYYIPIQSDDLDGYTAALAALESSDDIYFIVPMSQNDAIIDLCRAHVLAMSDPNRGSERHLVCSKKINTTATVLDKKTDNSAYTGYVAIDSITGKYTNATIPNGDLLTKGIRIGDVLQTSFSQDAFGNDTYDSYRIAAVIDSQNVKLASPGAPTAVASQSNPIRVRIMRTLTKDEEAAEIGAASSSLKNRHVVAVWPDTPIDDAGTAVAGHFLAAAVAGLKSSVVPHQSITNVVMNGFSSMPRTARYFTPTQLNVIAGLGTLIVTQAVRNGANYVRHGITTDNTDTNMAEWSVQTNVDSMAKFFRSTLKPYVGQYNISPNFIALLYTVLRHQIDFLRGNTATLKAGPQLVDTANLKVDQDPLIRTRVTIKGDFLLPYPANNIDMTIVVV